MIKPPWWDWEYVFENDHIGRRTRQRGLDELILRDMLERATEFAPDPIPGRFAIKAYREGALWSIIVEPQIESETVVVVTVFLESP